MADADINGSGWSPGGAVDHGSTPPRRERSLSPRREDRDAENNDRGRNRDRGRPNDSGDNNPGNNLHVSGVSNRLDDRALEEAFSKFGKVQKAQVMYDPHTREPRGFAFVTMETAEEADAAVEGMNGTELSGRVLSVQKARRGRARTPTPGRYHGPPKREGDVRGPPPRGGGHYDRYGPPRDYDRYGPPRDYPPPRDYDRYGPPPPRDYDRHGGGHGPPPPRDYPPPPRMGGYGGPPRDYSPPRRAPYDAYDAPPPRGRYDEPPPPRRY